jgi:osmotically-inducible protein OsmY
VGCLLLGAAVWIALLHSHATAAPPRVSVDRGGTLPERWLAATTAVALFGEPRVSGGEVGDMRIHAEGDRVELRGVVDSVAARQAASDVAGSVPGVESIANELAVAPTTAPVARDDTDIARDVARALRTAPELRDATIRLRVEAARVTLLGTVPDVGAWARASRTARDVVGVRAVHNQLVVEHLELSAQ